MKKITVLLLVFFMASVFSLEAMNSRPGNHYNGHPRPQRHHGISVGAPLDGGLLSILGAAGVVLYLSRKKKRTPGN